MTIDKNLSLVVSATNTQTEVTFNSQQLETVVENIEKQTSLTEVTDDNFLEVSKVVTRLNKFARDIAKVRIEFFNNFSSIKQAEDSIKELEKRIKAQAKILNDDIKPIKERVINGAIREGLSKLTKEKIATTPMFQMLQNEEVEISSKLIFKKYFDPSKGITADGDNATTALLLEMKKEFDIKSQTKKIEIIESFLKSCQRWLKDESIRLDEDLLSAELKNLKNTLTLKEFDFAKSDEFEDKIYDEFLPTFKEFANKNKFVEDVKEVINEAINQIDNRPESKVTFDELAECFQPQPQIEEKPLRLFARVEIAPTPTEKAVQNAFERKGQFFSIKRSYEIELDMANFKDEKTTIFNLKTYLEKILRIEIENIEILNIG